MKRHSLLIVSAGARRLRLPLLQRYRSIGTLRLRGVGQRGADFQRFWIGQAISSLGSSFTSYALPLIVFKLTGSPLDLGIATASAFLPYALFSLPIGAWTDRADRRQIMIIADLGRGMLVALVPLLATFDALSVWWIYGVGMLVSTLGIAFDACQFAALPRLVDRKSLVKANAYIQAGYSAGRIVGPMLAVLLVALLPVQQILLLDAISFAGSAVSIWVIRVPLDDNPISKERQVSSDIVDGLRFVFQNALLRNISIMLAMKYIVASAVFGELVVFAKLEVSATDSQVALYGSAGALGILAVSFCADPLSRRFAPTHMALGTLMLEGLLTATLGFSRSYWFSLCIWSGITGLMTLFSINTNSLRQTLVPDELLGRVITVAGMLAWSFIPIGSVLGGLVIQWTRNVALVYRIMGSATALIALAFSFTALGHPGREALRMANESEI